MYGSDDGGFARREMADDRPRPAVKCNDCGSPLCDECGECHSGCFLSADTCDPEMGPREPEDEPYEQGMALDD